MRGHVLGLVVVTGLVGACASVSQRTDETDVDTSSTDGTDGTDDTDDTGVETEGVPPEIYSEPPSLTGVEAVTWTYPAMAENPDGDDLAYFVEGPDGMSVNEWGLVSWTPPIDSMGPHEVTLIVRDAGGHDIRQSFTLNVVEGTQTPRVQGKPSLGLSPGDTFRYAPSVLDPDDNVHTWSLEGPPGASQDSDGVITWAAPSGDTSGASFTVTAVDPTGRVGTQEFFVGLDAPSDRTGPAVAITAPRSGAVVTDYTDVIGSVSDPNLAGYTLDLCRPTTDHCDRLADGLHPVSAGVLGRLDPHRVAKGPAELVLTGTDAGGRTSEARTPIELDGEPFGAVRLGFEDLTVSRRGGSWTLTRMYDGFLLEDGPLGVGWRFGSRTTEVGAEADQIGNIYEGYRTSFSFGGMYIEETTWHGIDITIDDGRLTTFRLNIELQPGLSPASILPARPTVVRESGSPMQLTLVDERGNPYSTTAYDLNVCVGKVYTDGSCSTLFKPYWKVTLDSGESLTFDHDGELIAGSVRGESADGVTIDLEAGTATFGDDVLVRFEKNSDGRVTAAIDPSSGARVQYRQDASGDLVAATMPTEQAQTFAYEDHRLHDFEVEGRSPEAWYYDADGRLIRHQGPTGQVMTHRYEDEGRTIISTDALGASITTEYDVRGNPVRITDPLGNQTVNTFKSGSALLASTTDPLGRTTRFDYDTSGRKTLVVDDLGNRTTMGYAEPGDEQPNTVTDGEGRTFTEVMGSSGVSAYRLPDGSIASRFSGTENTLTETRADGTSRTLTIDDRGRATRIVVNGEVTTAAFDDDRGQLTITEPDGSRIEGEIDVLGRAIDVNMPEGTASYRWDGDDLAEVTHPGGVPQVFHRDVAGRPVAVEIDGVVVQRHRYDALGRVASVTDNGRTTSYRYDALGRTTRVSQPDGYVEMTWDDASQLTRVQSDDGSYDRQITYDRTGRVAESDNGEGSAVAYDYDKAGRPTRATDGTGRVTNMVYDDNGRVKTLELPGGVRHDWTWVPSVGDDPLEASWTGSDGARFDYAYTAGELTRVEASDGGLTQYARVGDAETITDAEGRTWVQTMRTGLRTTQWPDGRKEVWETSTDGDQQTWTRIDGSTIEMTWDEDSRVLTTQAGEVYEISEDQLTGWIEETTPDGVTARRADLAGRVVELDDSGGATAELAWTVDNQLGEIAIVLPSGDRRQVGYTYDDAGRLASIVDPNGDITEFTWDESDRLLTIERPNGVDTTYTYGAWERPTTIEHTAGGTPFFESSLTYDSRGRVSSWVQDEGRGDVTYDEMGRIAQIRQWDQTDTKITDESRFYDRVGNRVEVDGLEGTTTHVYDAMDRLTSTTHPDGSTTTRTYSDRGALLATASADGTTWYEYDPLDRLTKVTTPDGEATEYRYDASGRMVQRTDGTGTRRCLAVPTTERAPYDACLAWYNPDGDEVDVVVHGPTGPLAVLGAETSWMLPGLHDHTVGTVDETGAVTSSAQYSVDGVRRTSGATSMVGWLGELQDPNHGLVYLHARWYDPQTGRFLNPDRYDVDPGDPRTLHRYVYGFGDPLNRIDRSGEFSIAGMLSGISVSNTMRAIRAVVTRCIGRKAIKKIIGQAVGAMVWHMVKEPLDDIFLSALGTAGIGGLPGAGAVLESHFEKHLGQYLCKKRKRRYMDARNADFEFQVRLSSKLADRGCGVLADHLANDNCTVKGASFQGIDILFRRTVPIELKGKEISLHWNSQPQRQLLNYCRFAARQSHHVMIYVFWQMPHKADLWKYARRCFKCWKPWQTQLWSCNDKGRPRSVGSIFVAFSFLGSDDPSIKGKRVFVPSPSGLCGG